MNSTFSEILSQVEKNELVSMEVTIGGRTYTRLFQPRERLILAGGGNVSQYLCQIGAMLGFAVTVIDDRPDFASASRFPEASEVICGSYMQTLKELQLGERDYIAVITRGHQDDMDCLRVILSGTQPRYVGLMGSQGRADDTREILEKEGFSRSQVAHIHAPIGIPIQAQTPQEIAVSIAAEMVRIRRSSLPRQDRDGILLDDDVDLKLLKFLAEDPIPKAAVLVYGTSGVTPARSGAIMAVDEYFNTVGTLGGGCQEHEAALEAYHMIGSGSCRTFTADLSDERAAGEGLPGGGQMELYLWDVVQSA